MESEWIPLCISLARNDLIGNESFSNSINRANNDEELVKQLSIIFEKDTAENWEKKLCNQGVGCVKVEDSNMFNFFSTDDHVKMNEFTTQVSHKRFGEFWRYSPILNFSSSKSKAGPGILRGQDTIPILSELGFTSDEIDTFKTDGVIGWEEIQPFAE